MFTYCKSENQSFRGRKAIVFLLLVYFIWSKTLFEKFGVLLCARVLFVNKLRKEQQPAFEQFHITKKQVQFDVNHFFLSPLLLLLCWVRALEPFSRQDALLSFTLNFFFFA